MLLNEYAVVRLDRMEAGTKSLPGDHPRRCRYYVRAASHTDAVWEARKRWPNEMLRVTEHRANVTAHVWPEDKKAPKGKEVTL